MKPLAIFNQKDIFSRQEDNWQEITFEDRLTGKAIVYDFENKIALVGNKVNSFFLLPGGGIDDESIEDGIVRECFEEIGCRVTLLSKVGVIEDYRNRDKKHCITHCYIAKLKGEKGKLSLTEEEAKNGMQVSWFSIDEALKILEDEVSLLKAGEVPFYNTAYNILRDYTFIQKSKLLI